jgi:hypothetical protein
MHPVFDDHYLFHVHIEKCGSRTMPSSPNLDLMQPEFGKGCLYEKTDLEK